MVSFGLFCLMGYRDRGSRVSEVLGNAVTNGAMGGGGGLRGRLVRRAPLLQLLRLSLAAGHGQSLRRPHPADQARPGGDRGAALSPGPAPRRDRHDPGAAGRGSLPAGARQRLSALRVRALRRRPGRFQGPAGGVPRAHGPRVCGRDLQLRRRLHRPAGDQHQHAPAGRRAADLDRGRFGVDAQAGGAARLRADHHRPLVRRRLPGRAAGAHRRVLRRRGPGRARRTSSGFCASSA